MNTAIKQKFSFPILCLLAICASCGNPTTGDSNMGNNSSSQNDPNVRYDDPSLPRDERNLTPLEYSILSLEGTDTHGRKISRQDNFKTTKKYVGLFYSLWHGSHETGIYDITKLLATPDGKMKAESADDYPESPKNAFHYWGEPLFGYYHSADPYVIKKHLEMFLLADVDYLIFDATNSVLYPEATKNLLDIWLSYQQKGYPVPKLAFYTNSYSAKTVDSIYRSFYEDGTYDSLWFSIDGLNPLIIGITENNAQASDETRYRPNQPSAAPISNAMYEFFDIRESEWPNGVHNDNSIPWMTWEYPQPIHTQTRAVSIPVAQHSHRVISVSSEDPECSRGYIPGSNGQKEEDWTAGRSFQTMWDSAIERQDQIDYYLCTGWNEWMAMKGEMTLDGVKRSSFVDVYSEEYSRDLEPERGKLGDSGYLQLIENIRRLKMTDYVRYAKEKRSIDIHSFDEKQWEGLPSYQDLEGDPAKRDFKNCVLHSTDRYVDHSGRNDFVKMQVTQDDENLYFRVETVDPITSYDNKNNYMNLFLRTNDEEGFMGFQYVINRDGNGSVEKSTGGYVFEKVGSASVDVQKNVMQLAVKKSLVGYQDKEGLSFKWADSVSKPEDELDYYVSGDVAPIGRLGFGY